MDVKDIVDFFDLSGVIVGIEESKTGNINRTYIISMLEDGIVKKYTLQRINVDVFKDPYRLMKNIDSVTDYCRHYIDENGGDVERETLSVVKTINGDSLFKVGPSEYYRMYNYVTGSRTYDKADSAEMFHNVGVAFGKFAHMLDGYPMDELKETIPNFHNSKVRFLDFMNDVERDACGRVEEVLPEIKFIMDRKDVFNTLVDMLDNGDIPYRVTHNDTKINNVLIDEVSGEAICVIDLDTVMPGSALYDFGDAIRSGAATAVEDDPDLDKVSIDMDYFRSFTEAYLNETSEILTKAELDYLSLSCIILTLELAMRFLNDYINGDTYFKCNYEKHNLDRARNQIKLVKEMEARYEEMVRVVSECVKKVKARRLEKDCNS